MPGLTGTVVRVNSPLGSWPRSASTFDVLWDNMTCTRAVAESLIEGPGWCFLDTARLTERQCTDRWMDFQLYRVKQRQNAQPPAVRAEQRAALPAQVLAPPPGTMAEVMTQQALLPAQGARSASRATRDLLAQHLPGCAFAVSCERRVLSISWLDGPIPGNVWRVVGKLVDGKTIEKVKLHRALTESLAQAAVNYSLWRVFGSDETALARYAQRVNAVEYLSHGLDSVRAESGQASGLTFQALVRCIVDRWDDARQRFFKTKGTAGLVSELRAMFPDGDELARCDFLAFRRAVVADQVAGRELIDDLRGRVREA